MLSMMSSILQIKNGLILVLLMASESLLSPLMEEKGMELEIIPGDDTTILKPPHSHPWTVGLAFTLNGRIKCGGTLISRWNNEMIVLTAAHCVVHTRPSHVVVGEHDQTNPNDGQEFVAVKKIHFHPKWIAGNKDYDLAMIELHKKITNPYAKALSLPWANEKFAKYIVDGWGSTSPNGKLSDVLRTVSLDDIKATDPLAYKCQSLGIDYNIHICGENLNHIERGTCGGDSGGPWVGHRTSSNSYVLAGVHIRGACSDHSVAHAAMRLSNYPDIMKWIYGI